MRTLFPLAALFLASCAQQPPAPPPALAPPQPTTAPQASVPSARTAGDARARVCEVGRVGTFRAGAGTMSPMTVSNEGGWCRHGFRFHGSAFSGGNIVTPPANGEARVRHLARTTVLEYRPTPGFVGSDRFVATLTPSGGTYIVEVTVQP